MFVFTKYESDGDGYSAYPLTIKRLLENVLSEKEPLNAII